MVTVVTPALFVKIAFDSLAVHRCAISKLLSKIFIKMATRAKFGHVLQEAVFSFIIGRKSGHEPFSGTTKACLLNS